MLTSQQLSDAFAELIKYSLNVCLLFIALIFVGGMISHYLHNRTHKKIIELRQQMLRIETYIGELREEIKKGKSIDALREEIKAIKDQ